MLAQWLPVMVMLLAIWLGLLYNNKRQDDFKDLLRAEVGASKAELKGELGQTTAELRGELGQTKAELRSELGQTKAELHADIGRSEQRILQAIADLKSDVQTLGHRVEKLEAPLIRP